MAFSGELRTGQRWVLLEELFGFDSIPSLDTWLSRIKVIRLGTVGDASIIDESHLNELIQEMNVVDCQPPRVIVPFQFVSNWNISAYEGQGRPPLKVRYDLA